jgi:signal transduction histidine kinase
MVEIKVADSGIGMNSDILSKLFKIHEQISRKGTNGELSTGLGLLLCKEFVEKNGGSISVESEPGLGSVFSFTLKNFKVI